jgi:NAD(P)-dependent dehydrogenase (short-subunit alcohol dehydrogenase family)
LQSFGSFILEKKGDLPMSRPLAGKVALVTGGSRGIGAAIVRRLASDGAAVAFTYSASQDQAEALATAIKAAGGYRDNPEFYAKTLKSRLPMDRRFTFP